MGARAIFLASLVLLAPACRPGGRASASNQREASAMQGDLGAALFVPSSAPDEALLRPAVLDLAGVTCVIPVGGPRTAALSGRVTDERGAAVAGATVVVAGPDPLASAITDGKGQYVVSGLVVPGPYAVSARPPKGSGGEAASLGYVCVSEAVHVLPDLQLTSPSHAAPGHGNQGRRICRTCHAAAESTGHASATSDMAPATIIPLARQSASR